MNREIAETVGQKKLVRVWHDPDDDLRDEDGIKRRKVKLEAKVGQPYQNRLTENFEQVFGPTPEWARLGEKDRLNSDSDEENDRDETDSHQIFPSRSSLTPGKINIVRTKDLNTSRSEGPIIRSVDFHPKNPVGLVAGSSNIVSFYQVDGSTNAPIQSVTFEKFPLRKAIFCAAGDEVYVCSGLVEHFYSYDMISGKSNRVKPNYSTQNETIRNILPSPDDSIIAAVGHNGCIYLHSKRSKEVIDTLSINGEVKDVAFSPEGLDLFAYSEHGDVYQWNMRTRRCVEKFSGEANFDGTCLSVSSKYIACGSKTGFVSIFENKHEPMKENEVVSCRARKSLAELGNLQTVVTSLKFNSSEEILAIGSVEKENALRLVHLPSFSVFQQFPFINSNYGRPNSIVFSPNSGYMALGSNRGCAYLFRVKHYGSY